MLFRLKPLLAQGHEIPLEFKDVADYEQWDWTKVRSRLLSRIPKHFGAAGFATHTFAFWCAADPSHAFHCILVFSRKLSRVRVQRAGMYHGLVTIFRVWTGEDSDSFTSTQADTNDQSVRKIVNDYWRWDGDFGKGRTWAAGKTYK